MRMEAGQIDRAAVPAADLNELAERHGFDFWLLYGAPWQAIIGGLASLDADDLDPATLAAYIATLTTSVDTLHTFELLTWVTVFDAALARLLTAGGQPEQARARLDSALALAEDTGMHFYDAELLRLRGHTHTDPATRQADIAAALDLARRQDAPLFELRAALDDFELRGAPARGALADVAARIPADSTWPELARARAILDHAAHGFE